MNKANKKSILKGGMWGSKPKSSNNNPVTPTDPNSNKPNKPTKPTKPNSKPPKKVLPKKSKKEKQIGGWGGEKKNKTKKSKKVNTLVGAGWGGVPPPSRYLVGGGWGGRSRPIMIDASKLRQEKGSRFINKYFKKYF